MSTSHTVPGTGAGTGTGIRGAAGRLAAVLVAAAAVLPALTGCGSGPTPASATRGDTRPLAETTDAATKDTSTAAPATGAVAVSDGAVTVYRSPDPASATSTLPETTRQGSRRVLLVTGAAAGGAWLRVRVPARPNHTQGWVRTADVRLQAVRHRVAIDLSDRTLVLYADGKQVLRATVAIGAGATPTPTGSFFVTDSLTAAPGGPYGPHALGISAWSEQLTEFAGGDGQIGLHGTNRPTLLGKAVSHGCIRMSNQVVTELAAELPLGAPVDISA